MPKPPGDLDYFDKVNYVIDAWTVACEAPWYIYISTLKPALLTAFITLITFGWDDVARGYFRPRGLGRRTSKGRRGKPGRGFPRFPELGEEIGKRIPGADEVKGFKWGRFGNTLWRIDTIVQQGLFWWLVADVTIDLAYNWTSVLYETRWCQDTPLGRFSYQNTIPRDLPGDVWWPVNYNELDYQFAPPSWFFNEGISGPNGCLVAAAAEVKPIVGFDPPTEFEIMIRERHGSTIFGLSGPNALAPDNTGDGVISGGVPPNTGFDVLIRHNGVVATIHGGAITAKENE